MSDWKGKKILLTGAGGFIGSHLAVALLQAGASLRAMVRYNSRGEAGWLADLDPALQAGLQIFPGDLLNPAGVMEAVQGCQVVFHLGAHISIPYSYRHPDEVVQTNVLGTLNVLNACRKAGVERLVHTSSSEVYGSARYVPIDEDHPLQGQSPYSASKIAADKLAESFFCAYGLPVVTLRPFNTYGPRQSARAVIPALVCQALSGDVVHLGAVDTWRDFTYVSDTAAGFLAAACAPGVEGLTINLGTGAEIRIGDLTERVIRLAAARTGGQPARLVVDEQRLRPQASEVTRLVSDNSRARSLLGWQPQVAFDDGLSQTIDWIEAHLESYQPERYAY